VAAKKREHRCRNLPPDPDAEIESGSMKNSSSRAMRVESVQQ